MSYTRGPGPLQGEHDKLKACIGIVEDGDTATHAIATGQYVVWKNDLYVAKSDIQIGTTLSAESNGNLTVKTNGLGNDFLSAVDELENLKDSSITKYLGTVSSKTAKYLASTSACYCLIFTYAASVSYMGIWIAYMRAKTATSNCVVKSIVAPGDSITVSVSTSRIKIDNQYGGAISVSVLPLGSAKKSWYSLETS